MRFPHDSVPVIQPAIAPMTMPKPRIPKMGSAGVSPQNARRAVRPHHGTANPTGAPPRRGGQAGLTWRRTEPAAFW